MSRDGFTCRIVPLISHGFFWITFSGEMSIGRLARAHEQFVSHPDYAPGIDELLDFSHASVKQIGKADIETIRQYMAMRPDRHHSKSVIIVSSELEYGLSRMMGSRLELDAPVERHVAYSLDDALEWLRPGQADALVAAREEALASGRAVTLPDRCTEA